MSNLKRMGSETLTSYWQDANSSISLVTHGSSADAVSSTSFDETDSPSSDADVPLRTASSGILDAGGAVFVATPDRTCMESP